jgi:hypothetical protein
MGRWSLGGRLLELDEDGEKWMKDVRARTIGVGRIREMTQISRLKVHR